MSVALDQDNFLTYLNSRIENAEKIASAEDELWMKTELNILYPLLIDKQNSTADANLKYKCLYPDYVAVISDCFIHARSKCYCSHGELEGRIFTSELDDFEKPYSAALTPLSLDAYREKWKRLFRKMNY